MSDNNACTSNKRARNDDKDSSSNEASPYFDERAVKLFRAAGLDWYDFLEEPKPYSFVKEIT